MPSMVSSQNVLCLRVFKHLKVLLSPLPCRAAQPAVPVSIPPRPMVASGPRLVIPRRGIPLRRRTQ
jgi:hypothetical protein